VKASTEKFSSQPEQWVAFMTESQDFPKEIVEIGVERVDLDSALYPQEAGVLAGKMSALGLIRKQPSDEQLNKFFVTE